MYANAIDLFDNVLSHLVTLFVIVTKQQPPHLFMARVNVRMVRERKNFYFVMTHAHRPNDMIKMQQKMEI